ncbi:MAG: hypothetical protein AUH42_02450 [Gemmatimonadetes bacterium 13_1_40CM_70_11]|nr:MAG: hypothetical protein AUH42_02450 [Gemmatimonadetes bacterium 13_1_40CM_70_11]
MISYLLLAVLLQGAGAPSPRALTPRDSAYHVLNRLAYGPRPGDLDSVARLGVMRWIDLQLDPRHIDNPFLAERERQFPFLGLSRDDLARLYLQAQRARQERLRADSMSRAATDAADQTPEALRARRIAGQFQELAVVRAVLSQRQLEEVMVDFWTNHFNVFFGKGADRFLTPSYIEATIRPNALGKFADLLIATAQSPAMLFYLDNAESVAPGSVPPQLARLQARTQFGLSPRRRIFLDPMGPMRADSLRQRALLRMPKGLNENYARELMELHTLGVDGGYTQQDVINVARIFTGWSLERPQQGAGFVFNDWAHDYGAKTVVGVTFPAGHGMDEGLRLLKLLASEHATMHHVSKQLCARFVADDPPDGCVDDAVAAWHRSGGDIREVLRAIFHGPDFWAPQNVDTKLKTPLEFVVSAVRAVGADPDTTPRLAQVVARLGEPLYQHVAPDGYPEREEDWVNSGALLARMNAAVALASGQLSGVTVNLDAVAPATADADQLIGAIDDKIFAGRLSPHTKQVIRDQVADVRDPEQARTLAIGLALGGPDFQRQ